MRLPKDLSFLKRYIPLLGSLVLAVMMASCAAQPAEYESTEVAMEEPVAEEPAAEVPADQATELLPTPTPLPTQPPQPTPHRDGCSTAYRSGH